MKMTNGINVVKTEEKRRLENLFTALKGKKITILGHDNIDVDATLSGILMSKLLDFLNIENQFTILEEVKKDDTYEIIEELLGIDMKEWEVQEENEDREIFLVDHYETVHKGHVVGCIDHHPTKQKKSYEFMYTRNACAAAYLIYEIMKEVNFPIEKEIAKMVIVAMMVDTTSFRSSKTITEEVEQAKKLAKEYNIDYSSLEKSCLCLTPIEKLSTTEIISNGQKWYNYNESKVGSAYLQLYGLPNEEKVNFWISSLKEKLNQTNSDMLVFIIFDTKSNKTYEYRVTKFGIQKFIKNGILSRGKDIMPVIEKMF